MAEVEVLVMSVPDAARALGISRAMGYQLVASGQLPSFRLGTRVLVPKAGVERLINAAFGETAAA